MGPEPLEGTHFLRGFAAEGLAAFIDDESIGPVDVMVYRFHSEPDDHGNFDNELFWGVMTLHAGLPRSAVSKLLSGSPISLASHPTSPMGRLPVPTLRVMPMYPAVANARQYLIYETD